MVSSYLQLLEHRYANKLDATANEFIHYAVDGALRMRTLVRDLLEYSRVGRRKQELTPVNCRLVFDNILVNLKETIADTKAKVTAGDLPTVQADITELTQLFQNLIGNAIKFHGDQPPVVHVTADRQDGHWHFIVRDNGIGIAPEFADRIFVIFQRLHSRSNYPGNGLGLAICKKIVERYGGRIWVQSTPGHGAIFHFTLPALSRKDQSP